MNSVNQGYFRSPTIYQDQVVFLCEDDLWQVPLTGGKAYRITNSRGEIISPVFSPDGKWIACSTKDEGAHDIYILPAEGGPLQRLTFLDTSLYVVGWSLDSQYIIFRSSHQAVHRNSDSWLYKVSLEGGPIERLEYGPACFLDHSPDSKGIVLGRNTITNSRWKRYRGGTAGEIWIDTKGNGKFKRLLKDLPGNPVCPLWIEDRIYFLSDHEGIGNLYSCQTDGQDIRKETHQSDYYVRYPASDKKHIVFHIKGDLWSLNVENRQLRKIEITWSSTKVQAQRKFSYGNEFLENASLHHKGHEIAVISRGKLFAMPLWEKAALQYGPRDGVRHRLVQWLNDGRLVTISDQHHPHEKLCVYDSHPSQEPKQLINLPPGRVQELISAPQKNEVVFTTSRMELYLLNVDSGKYKKIDSSEVREISNPTFSPDGHWVAYCKHLNLELTAIFLVNLNLKKKPHQITAPVRYDFAPSFDPKGRWLYFLSSRTYNPIWDSVQLATTFSRSVKPYLLTLQKDIVNPFLPEPHAPGEKEHGKDDESSSEDDQKSDSKKKNEKKKDDDNEKIQDIDIDLEGIENRIIEFPVQEGLYGQITGINNKVLFTEYPLTGDSEEPPEDEKDSENGILWMYDFENHEKEQLTQGVSEIHVTPSAKTLLYRMGDDLRVLEAGASAPDESDTGHSPSRKSGWLDLKRIRISINYPEEWFQMYRESWRLQQEFFWTEDLSGIDWEKIYERYKPLIAKIGSRSELSDIIWEMQGELGTSHAYEWGGEYHPTPRYFIGYLGADLAYDKKKKGYKFTRIFKGDVWKKGEHSPLCETGQEVKEGDYLLAIGGVPVNKETSPGQLLVHQANENVLLTVQGSKKNSELRHITVRTLNSEKPSRYRDWVNNNRKTVADATEGRVGYIHIPDMQSAGISEFHRGYLAQVDKEGLIIDVRYNAGGMVSPLILEKLAHRHLGYDVPRWGSPESYPYHTIHGHLVALTNEFAGSDGDMFCHSFKTLKLGPLVGKRTWGGVIGIDGRYQLVDGTITTQPQYSIWFHNAGWSIENYGVEPDIEVEYPPQAYNKEKDPQLERAIKEVLYLLEQYPVRPIKIGKKN